MIFEDLKICIIRREARHLIWGDQTKSYIYILIEKTTSSIFFFLDNYKSSKILPKGSSKTRTRYEMRGKKKTQHLKTTTSSIINVYKKFRCKKPWPMDVSVIPWLCPCVLSSAKILCEHTVGWHLPRYKLKNEGWIGSISEI